MNPGFETLGWVIPGAFWSVHVGMIRNLLAGNSYHMVHETNTGLSYLIVAQTLVPRACGFDPRHAPSCVRFLRSSDTADTLSSVQVPRDCSADDSRRVDVRSSRKSRKPHSSSLV